MMGIIIGTCVPDAEPDAAAYGAQLRRPPRRILYGKATDTTVCYVDDYIAEWLDTLTAKRIPIHVKGLGDTHDY